ncbi:MAG TPA: hypothetical protein VM370_12090 [Candidatus Thermoplasmatota archaeon]|nr:hypothetical protein [Candidatus Thermoplasmatota archaeon]
MAPRDRTKDRSFAARIPGVRALAALFERIASVRVGRVPMGLLALLPVSLFIDLFDVADELAAGPVGMTLSFFVESAFLLGLTGSAGYSLGAAAFDFLPGLDVVPFATITLVREIMRAWGEPGHAPARGATGPIIDV